MKDTIKKNTLYFHKGHRQHFLVFSDSVEFYNSDILDYKLSCVGMSTANNKEIVVK